MKTLLKRLSFVSIIFLMILGWGSCNEDVALPASSIILDRDAILASSLESEFLVNVSANCPWIVSVEDNAGSWLSSSLNKSRDNQSLIVKVSANNGDAREAKLKIASESDPSVFKFVTVKQPGNNSTLSISELRLLRSNISVTNPEYIITDNWKINGIVNTYFESSNFPVLTFGIQDAKTSNSGIAVKTATDLWLTFGKVVEISLQNAILSEDENGVLELRPSGDDKVKAMGSDDVQLNPVEISYDDFASGDYESMYIALPNLQVLADDLNKQIEGWTQLQDAEGNRYNMFVYSEATFANESTPIGSGTLSGIASIINSERIVLPMHESDFNLTGSRFTSGTGIKLPYIFSFKAKSASSDNGMYYNTMRMSDGSPWVTPLAGQNSKQIIEPNDGSGMMMTFWKQSASSSNSNGVEFKVVSGSVDNIIAMRMWPNSSPKGYALFTYPLGEDISGPLYFSFSLAGTNYAPAQWSVQFSTDNQNWSAEQLDASIPETKIDVPHFYTVALNISGTLAKGTTLYIKLIPYTLFRIGNLSQTSTEGGEVRLSPAVILSKQEATTTSVPSGAVYFESFDRIYGGVDYLLGDKICNLAVFTGGDISTWSTSEKAGLSGSNVSKRPGYVQIGYVPFSGTNCTKADQFVNNVGELTTSALSSLSSTKNVTLKFKAMAYKTKSSVANSLDINGDKTDVKVEILNGGTIGGQTSTTVSGLSYSKFQTFSLDIDNATSATKIKFTSEAVSGEYTRWFIDEILVVEK